MSKQPQDERSKIRELYLEECWPVDDILDELGCARSTFYKKLEKHGIEKRGQTVDMEAPFREAETLTDLYWGQGLTIPETADEVGASVTTVKKWMNHHGIPRRDPQEASKAVRRVERATYAIGTDGYPFWQSRVGESLKHVYVHRLLAVAEYGYDAVCGKVVHHRNHVPWDNRPDNIELMTTEEHNRHHASKEGPEIRADGGRPQNDDWPPVTVEAFGTWQAKAMENVAEWGLQDTETLLLAMQEEQGELAQAYLEATHEDGDPGRVADELDDLAALLLQLKMRLEEQEETDDT